MLLLDRLQHLRLRDTSPTSSYTELPMQKSFVQVEPFRTIFDFLIFRSVIICRCTKLRNFAVRRSKTTHEISLSDDQIGTEKFSLANDQKTMHELPFSDVTSWRKQIRSQMTETTQAISFDDDKIAQKIFRSHSTTKKKTTHNHLFRR